MVKFDKDESSVSTVTGSGRGTEWERPGNWGSIAGEGRSPSLPPTEYPWLLPRDKNGRGVTVNTHFHSVPQTKKAGALPLQ